ncbi:MAG TPA: hypothetical protein VGG11_13780 [Xanthobacteraceae bacterium]|jgi:hypothetical protein
MLHSIASAFVGIGIFISSLFGAHPPAPQLGAALPSATAVFETSLASRISSTDTSMTLAANSVAGGTSLSGYQCFTLDEGLSTAEYVCGIVSGTSVTNMQRGIDPQTGTTTNSSLQFTHRVGADVKITDFPVLQILRNQANGAETFPNPLLYQSHPCSVSSASTTVCDKNYVDGQIVAGGVPGTNSVAGILLTANGLQAASSTATGVFDGISYNRVLPSTIATDTPNVGINTSDVLMSDLTGHLKQGWLDLTKLFAFSGGILSTASSTYTATTTIAANNVNSDALNLNGINYAFPSAQTAGFFLKTDGNGNLAWANPISHYSLLGSVGATGGPATSSILAIPAGVMQASSTISVLGGIECDNGTTCTYSLRDSGGTVLAQCTVSAPSTNNLLGTLNFVVANQSSLSSQKYVGLCQMIQTSGSSITPSTNFISQTNGTSAFTTANALNLVLVLSASNNNTVNFNNFSIIVNP